MSSYLCLYPHLHIVDDNTLSLYKGAQGSSTIRADSLQPDSDRLAANSPGTIRYFYRQ